MGNINIHNACERGDLGEVERYLEAGGDIEKKYLGNTPLSVACRCGHTEVVSLLMEKGASLEYRDYYGDTPLSEACRCGHTEVVSLLMEKGASLEYRDNAGWTPLSVACIYGHTEVVSLLMEKGASWELDYDGNTCLHLACRYGQAVVISLLLERGRGVDLESRNDEGKTPEQVVCTGVGVSQKKKSECLAVLAAFKKKPSAASVSRPDETPRACPPPPPPVPSPNPAPPNGNGLDREVASLRAQLSASGQVIAELRSEKVARDSEMTELRDQISSLQDAVLKKDEALTKLRQRQGIGLKEPHVRMGCNAGRVRVVDGVYRNRHKDTPCKLKMAFDEPQCSRLEREAAILRTIRTGDPHGEHSQHIVTWLYPDHFLTHQSDNLYLADEAGDLSPSSASPAAAAVSPMKSLVLESGGVNLKQLLLSNGSRFTVPVAQRVHILQDIVGALHFLHGLNIVHFDVKPENIVCFSSASGSGSRWKLIDLDSSYDVNLPPSSPGGLPVISCCSSANDEVLVTKEYLSPEVMRVLNYRSPGRGDPHPSAASDPTPPADVEVSWRLDIWSLGLVAVFLFSGHSLWEALHPTRPFQHSMVSGVTQPQIQLLLSRSFGHKEKSFLEACLQVESRERKPAGELLAKSLFKTDNSTTLRLSSDSMNQRFADLEGLLSRYREESQSLVCDELEDKFSDFSLFLSNQLERVHHLSPEEKQTVVGEQGGR